MPVPSDTFDSSRGKSMMEALPKAGGSLFAQKMPEKSPIMRPPAASGETNIKRHEPPKSRVGRGMADELPPPQVGDPGTVKKGPDSGLGPDTLTEVPSLFGVGPRPFGSGDPVPMPHKGPADGSTGKPTPRVPPRWEKKPPSNPSWPKKSQMVPASNRTGTGGANRHASGSQFST